MSNKEKALDYEALEKELQIYKDFVKSFNEINDRDKITIFTFQEKEETLNYLIDLFDRGKDKTYYLPLGMVKLFNFLDFKIPDEISITNSEDKNNWHTIKFSIESN